MHKFVPMIKSIIREIGHELKDAGRISDVLNDNDKLGVNLLEFELEVILSAIRLLMLSDHKQDVDTSIFINQLRDHYKEEQKVIDFIKNKIDSNR